MKNKLSIFFTAALGGVLALGINNYVTTKPSSTTSIDQPAAARYVNYSASLPESTINFVQAADMSVHAVVHVKTTYNNEQHNLPYGYDPFRDFFFGDNGRRMPQMASGSGVIISGDGYIVTNNHVIDRADKIEVTLNDKRTYTAELVGGDPTTDIALLKIKEDKLPYLVYGNSDDVKVGEWVLAVGNPFNLTSTVTAGIVSAKGRNISMLDNNQGSGVAPIESFIQTDAAVNPGNSGGALVTSGGQLIGINTAIASNTGSYAGYSFAVPVNIVKKVVNDLLEFGKVQRAFIGIGIRDIDSRFAADKKINNLKGIYVTGVTQSGAANEAGIKEGDIITKIGAIETNNTSTLLEQVSKYRPGDKISLTVSREGVEKVIPVVLKNKNGEAKLASRDNKEASVSLLGAVFEHITPAEKEKLGINNGVKITALEAGKLRSAGIKEGFIITSVDKKKITTSEDLNNVIENRTGGILIEGIYPNGMRAYYAFGL